MNRNYVLNYLDRQNIAAAKLAGVMEDLGLSITQYNTVVSVLFAGYSKSARGVLALHLAFADLESHHAGPFQSPSVQDPVSRPLHLLGRRCLGCDLSMHCCRQQLWESGSLPIHAWIC